MAVLEDVEVHVVSSCTRKRLVEYDNPNLDVATEQREIKKFIEAETDGEFYIRVKLKAGFDYHGADGVCIYLQIDGDAVDCYEYRRLKRRKIYRGKLIKDISYKFRDVPAKRSSGWVDVTFAFGKAETGRA